MSEGRLQVLKEGGSAIYLAGAVWEDGPPEALYHGKPVVDVIDPARASLGQALQRKQ